MSEKEVTLRASIHYYGVLHLFKSMQSCCLEAVRLFASDHRFRFYYSLSLLFEGRLQESIRELDSLQDKKSFSLASYIALIHAHKANKTPDVKVISELETNLRKERRMASDEGLFFAGLVLLFLGKIDKSIEYVDKLIIKSADYRAGKTLRGWIDLRQRMETQVTQDDTRTFFDESVESGDIEATLGKSMLLLHCNEPEKSLDLLKKITTKNSNFIPGFTEEMKCHLALKDWDSVIESSSKLLSLDRHSIEGLRYSILECLVSNKNNRSQEYLISRLKDLSTAMELREDSNASLYLESSRLLSCLSESNEEVIRSTITLGDKASNIDASFIVKSLNEVARQHLSLKRIKDAKTHYSNANKINRKDMDSFIGLLVCGFLTDNQDKELLSDLDSLEQLSLTMASADQSNQLHYLCAMTGESRGKNNNDIIGYLDLIVKNQLDRLSGNRLSLQYFLDLNPELMTQVIDAYLSFCSIEPLKTGQQMTHELKQASLLRDLLINACPGHRYPLLLSAKIKLLEGNLSNSLSLLNKFMEREVNPSSETSLLLAKIHLHLNHLKAAESALDNAVSLDFGIRKQSEYVIVKSSILRHKKKYEEAIDLLKTALDEMKNKTTKSTSSRENNIKISMTLELAQLHDLLDENLESERLLTDLENEFRETSFSPQILIARAVSAQNKGSLDQSLSILKSLGKNEDFFITSRQMMSHIYLKYRSDRRLYSKCFEEIADTTQSKESYLMLGDAFMNILEAEKAIEVYESCLKKNPKDSQLIRKVGCALITAHFFDKAVTYFKASIKSCSMNPSSPENDCLTLNLKVDLSSLLLRLKRHQESKEVILNALDKIEDNQQQKRSIEVTSIEAKLKYLLSQNQLVLDPKETVITSLKRAYSLQTKVVRRMSIERPDSLEENTKLLMKIGLQLSDLLAYYSRNYSQSISYLKELLSIDDKNIKLLSLLINIEILNNNLESAQQIASQILKFNPDDDSTLLMMIDVMFTQNDYKGAYHELLDILSKKTTNNQALMRLIEAAKKTGQIHTLEKIIESIAKSHPSLQSDMKFNFSCALFFKYVQDSSSSIKGFLRSKNHCNQIGKESLLHMIDLYLNPSFQIVGGSSCIESIDDLSKRQISVKSVNSLLNQLFSRFGDSFEYRFFKCMLYIIRGQREDYDQSINGFTELLKQYPNNPAPSYGLSAAFAASGQTSKAKNVLKKLFKQQDIHSSVGEASSLSLNLASDSLERSYLLMSDIYIESGKLEAAKQLLEKAIMINMSCIKAFELMALIKEKEGGYHEAVDNYNAAFELGLRRNPVIGYKLAYNCMRARLYSKAVDVAREVLVIHPNFPRIQHEIIDRSLAAFMKIL